MSCSLCYRPARPTSWFGQKQKTAKAFITPTSFNNPKLLKNMVATSKT